MAVQTPVICYSSDKNVAVLATRQSRRQKVPDLSLYPHAVENETVIGYFFLFCHVTVQLLFTKNGSSQWE